MQSSNWKWHLDEVFVKINGERHYLWRAVDAAQIELDAMGMIIENKRGTPNPNLLLSVIDVLKRRQLTVISSISLNQLASDPRTIHGSAKVEGDARAALKDVGVEGLLA
jgi:hypothetical protein